MPVARSDCQLERRRPALPVSIYQIAKLLNLDHELRKSTDDRRPERCGARGFRNPPPPLLLSVAAKSEVLTRAIELVALHDQQPR